MMLDATLELMNDALPDADITDWVPPEAKRGMLCETDRRMNNFKIANNNESERIYDFGCGAVARCLQ